jgi:predicted nucleotidyltransferase component of viral defense system
MIDYFQIQKLASLKEVPEDIIEKDYFIELLLYYLSNSKYFSEKADFRGGTALKKIYFPDYRYSEDLDFIVTGKENLADFEKELGEILLKVSDDFPFTPTKASNIKNDRLQIFFSYNIIPEIVSIKELKVDILNDFFIPSYEKKKIIFTHQDFKGKEYKLNTYTLESVAADKILKILDVDKEARDIYDLWYLLKLDLNIFKIREELIKRFGYDFNFHNLLREINSTIYKKTWKLRLEKQVLNLKPCESVLKELEELIKNKFS